MINISLQFVYRTFYEFELYLTSSAKINLEYFSLSSNIINSLMGGYENYKIQSYEEAVYSTYNITLDNKNYIEDLSHTANYREYVCLDGDREINAETKILLGTFRVLEGDVGEDLRSLIKLVINGNIFQFYTKSILYGVPDGFGDIYKSFSLKSIDHYKTKRNLLRRKGLSTLNVTKNFITCKYDVNGVSDIQICNPNSIQYIKYVVSSNGTAYTNEDLLESNAIINYHQGSIVNIYLYDDFNLQSFFSGSTYLYEADFSNVKLETVVSLYRIFSECINLKNVIWDKLEYTGTSLGYAFYNCKKIENIILPGRDLRDIQYAFNGCDNIKSVTGVFEYIENANYAFSNIKSSKELTIDFTCRTGDKKALLGQAEKMFADSTSLEKIIFRNIYTKFIYSMKEMFSGCTSLKELDLKKFDFYALVNGYRLFYNCKSLQNIYNFKFSPVGKFPPSYNSLTSYKNYISLFEECNSLKEIDLSLWKDSGEKNLSLSRLFYNCYNLTNINISNLNTYYITDFSKMFYGCGALQELDVSSFNTENATNMNGMFQYCQSLRELDLSNFTFTSIKYKEGTDIDRYDYQGVQNFLRGCTMLQSVKLGKGPLAMSGLFSSDYVNQGFTSENQAGLDSVRIDTFYNFLDGRGSDKINTIGTLYMPYVKQTLINNNIRPANNNFNVSGIPLSICSSTCTWNPSTETLETFPIQYSESNPSLYDVLPDSWNIKLTGYVSTNSITCIYDIPSSGTYMLYRNDTCIDSSRKIKLYNNYNDYVLGIYEELTVNSNKSYTVPSGEIIVNIPIKEQAISFKQFFYDITTLKHVSFSGLKSDITDVESMFYNCSSLEEIGNIRSMKIFNTKNKFNWNGRCTATSGNQLFYGCSSLKNMDLTSISGSFATMDQMFYKCSSLNEFPKIDFNSCTSAVSMFRECSSLETAAFKNDIQHITNFQGMFYLCKKLQYCVFIKDSLQGAQDMSYMFSGCELLHTVEYEDQNTQSLKNMSYMFNDCAALYSIDLTQLNLKSVTNVSYMFQNCKNLHYVQMYQGEDKFPTSISNFQNMFGPVVTSNSKCILTHGWFIFNDDEDCYKKITSPSTRVLPPYWNITSGRIITNIYEAANYNDELYSQLSGGYGIALLGDSFLKKYKKEGSDTMDHILESVTITDITDNKVVYDGAPIHTFWGSDGYRNLKRYKVVFKFIKDIDVFTFGGMYGMFENCFSLRESDLHQFNNSKMCTLAGMYWNCHRLEKLTTFDSNGLTLFSSHNVCDISGMFKNCYELKRVDFSKMNLSKLVFANEVFKNDKIVLIHDKIPEDYAFFEWDKILSQSQDYFTIAAVCTIMGVMTKGVLFTIEYTGCYLGIFEGTVGTEVCSTIITNSFKPPIQSFMSIAKDSASTGLAGGGVGAIIFIAFTAVVTTHKILSGMRDDGYWMDSGYGVENFILGNQEFNTILSFNSMFKNCTSLLEADFKNVSITHNNPIQFDNMFLHSFVKEVWFGSNFNIPKKSSFVKMFKRAHYLGNVVFSGNCDDSSSDVSNMTQYAGKKANACSFSYNKNAISYNKIIDKFDKRYAINPF